GISHADLGLNSRPVALSSRGRSSRARGGSTGEDNHGAARLQHAPALGSWRAFRPSGPPLESEDGAVHLRDPQQYPHHRPRPVGGIQGMGGLPDLMFVIDTNKEESAIKEASRLGLPVAAVVDTNCAPDGITFLVPGKDDAARAITLYCDLIARAAIDGISRAQ